MLRKDIRDFMNSSYCSDFTKELHRTVRLVHYARDNYGMNMPDSLEKALANVEKSLQIALTELLTEWD